MKSPLVSRRNLMAHLGATAALLTTLAANAAPRAPLRATTRSFRGAALLAPLSSGSRLGPWRVERVGDVRYGAVAVILRDKQGGLCCIDICRRDDMSELPPPARTDLFDLLVANGGNGRTRTDESHALAAQALAKVVRQNEHRSRVDGILTLRARLKKYSDRPLRAC